MISLYTKLNTLLAEMNDKQKANFASKRKRTHPIETQVNIAESVLHGEVKESLRESTVDLDESQDITKEFNEAHDELKGKGLLPRFVALVQTTDSTATRLKVAKQLLKEYVTPKHNGAADNGRGFLELLTENGVSHDSHPNDKLHEELRSYMVTGISEADSRKILGLPPAEIEKLGEKAVNWWATVSDMKELSEADKIAWVKKQL
jgi:hypothetical protein